MNRLGRALLLPAIAIAIAIEIEIEIERVAFPAGWVRGAPAPLDTARPAASLTLGPQRRTVALDALRFSPSRLPVTLSPEPGGRPPYSQTTAWLW